jgi:CheY-like chemotaxis protein/ribosome-associated translation inhibitor RaiA
MTTNSNQTLSIVLAEDDAEMRKLLAWSLERRGYEVVQCADGTSLMKKLGFLDGPDAPVTPDLIISDIRMPGVTGLQVLESASEFPDAPPVILITAFPDERARRQAARLGAVAMIAKPFDIEQLLEKVLETIPPELAARKNERIASDHIPKGVPYPLEITFRHHTGTDAVRAYVARPAGRLRRFAKHITRCSVVIDELDRAEPRKHRYELTLIVQTPGKTIVVKQATNGGAPHENLTLAINIAFGTACRKLKGYLQKQHVQKGTHANRASSLDMWTPNDDEATH